MLKMFSKILRKFEKNPPRTADVVKPCGPFRYFVKDDADRVEKCPAVGQLIILSSNDLFLDVCSGENWSDVKVRPFDKCLESTGWTEVVDEDGPVPLSDVLPGLFFEFVSPGFCFKKCLSVGVDDYNNLNFIHKTAGGDRFVLNNVHESYHPMVLVSDDDSW